MNDNVMLAKQLVAFMRGDWLPDQWSKESRRFIPRLLIGVYIAQSEGMFLSKRAAAGVMDADPNTSGPKYIQMAAEAGWIVVEDHPHDRRKHLVRPTKALMEIIEEQLSRFNSAAH